jgi:DNA-binding IclR family transcriptional regulator
MAGERKIEAEPEGKDAATLASPALGGSGTRESARHVDAVAGALDLLDCFDDREALSVGEFSNLTGINRSRVMRLAGTLESRGYLVFDSESRKYRLGYRVLTLGRRMADSLDIVTFSRPHLAELSRATGETASLFGIDGGMRIVLAHHDGHHEVRHALAAGDRQVLHSGASGKVLLAHCDPEYRDRIIDAAVAQGRLGGRDPDALRAELALVMKQGYAVSHGERLADAAAISAPVFDGSGIAASIGISGSAARFTPDFVKDAVPLVRSNAAALSQRMGWAGPSAASRRSGTPGGS